MRLSPIIFVLSLLATEAAAQGPGATPYERVRRGALDWRAGAGRHQSWRAHAGGISFYDPYLYAPPVIAGSWYQRPYPYHFDYYRARWGERAPTDAPPDVEMIPASDCPCAVPTPVEVLDPPAA